MKTRWICNGVQGIIFSLCLSVTLNVMAANAMAATSSDVKQTEINGAKVTSHQEKAPLLKKENMAIQFVQFASEAKIEKMSGNGKNASYKLVLKKVNPQVTFFSERPGRKMGSIPTEKYINHWNRPGDNSFQQNVPNGFLHAVEGNGAQERNTGKDEKHFNVGIELSNPRYDATAETFTYTVKLLEGNTHGKMPSDIHHVTLFIDDDVCLSCW